MRYAYEATKIDSTTWMVKRFDEHGVRTESLIKLEPNVTANVAIAMAIVRGSWA